MAQVEVGAVRITAGHIHKSLNPTKGLNELCVGHSCAIEINGLSAWQLTTWARAAVSINLLVATIWHLNMLPLVVHQGRPERSEPDRQCAEGGAR